jgi:uncharacterized membrane protein
MRLDVRTIACAVVVVAASCFTLWACSRKEDRPATTSANDAEHAAATAAPRPQTARIAAATAPNEDMTDGDSGAPAPAPAPQAAAPARNRAHDMGEPPSLIHCRGNEPFWSLELRPSRAVYSRLEGEGTEKTEVGGKYHTLPYVKNQPFIWRGKSKELDGDLIAVITDKPCFETMSDSEGRTRFPYSTLVSLPGGKVLRGCCWPDGDADAQPGDQAPSSDEADHSDAGGD